MNLSLSYRGISFPLQLSPDDSLSSLQTQIHSLTSVPPELQKLIWKGKKQLTNNDASLLQLGLKDGIKIQLLGSTLQEVNQLKAVEEQHTIRDRIIRERALKPQPKLRSTGPSVGSSQYRFHNIAPLPHLPDPESAKSILEKLANDHAILHIMQLHKFSVGLLTELAPHEQPGLLGLNVNAGQQIKLRIRTDRYDGFRLYKEIRRVLCHELTHNVWGDHDENFKELNSQLNRQVLEFERAQHQLSDLSGIYQPASEQEAEAHAHVLGGSSHSTPVPGESREDMRKRVLEATMNRLRKEEEELEMSCGTGKDLSSNETDTT